LQSFDNACFITQNLILLISLIKPKPDSAMPQYRQMPNLAICLIMTLIAITTATENCKAQAAYFVLIFGEKIAQEDFHLTIEAGLNHSQMPGIEGSKGKMGVYYGMGIFKRLSNKWALVPEFKPFSYRGADEVQPISSYDIDNPTYSLSLNYLDIPLLVQYKPTPHLYISTGPQISILLSAMQRGVGYVPGTERDIKISESFYDTFNPEYFSWPVEVGFIFPNFIQQQRIELKVRYDVSLTNVIADKSYGSSHISMMQFILSVPFIKDGSKNKNKS